MARPRRHNQHLPESVRFSHGAYYLVKAGKWQRLGKTLPKEYDVRRPTPMTRLVDFAMAEIYSQIKPSSARNYRSAVGHIKTAFAEYLPEQVAQDDIWDFRDQFAGIPVMGNTCLAVLREIFKYAVRKRVVRNNPVIGVDRFRTAPRDRLITPEEYVAIREKSSPLMQCLIDALFLTGQRVNDVIRLSRQQLGDEGIAFRQQKTGKRIVVQWTDELRAVVDRAKGLSDIPSIYLFSGRAGKPLGICTVQRAWDVACKAAGVSNAQLRDLRAMSLTAIESSNGEEAAMRLAAHSSLSVTRGYLRAKKVLTATGPKLPQTPASNCLKFEGK